MRKQAHMALSAGLLWLAAPCTLVVDGKVIYAQTCAQCHANGVAGAPRINSKSEWSQRLAMGREAMFTTVLKGKGAMPPKGGNASLSNADAQAAMEYMLNQLK